jgi:hypothetical protein
MLTKMDFEAPITASDLNCFFAVLHSDSYGRSISSSRAADRFASYASEQPAYPANFPFKFVGPN